jgi:hypothetical protein
VLPSIHDNPKVWDYGVFDADQVGLHGLGVQMDMDDGAEALAPAAWWRSWVGAHPVLGPAVIGVIATQVATMCGYYMVGVGLPELRWADFNGFFLATTAEPIGSTGSFFGGFMLHTLDGIVFAILFAALVRDKLPGANNTLGGIIKGVTWGLILGIISIGFLIPYVYLRVNHPSGFGGGLGLFSFEGPDEWKLPLAVLLWHTIWGGILGQLYQRPDTQ